LRFTAPDNEHRWFPLEAAVSTIGRAPNNDIIVEDRRLSRQHAQIRLKSRKYFVGDLGSTEGTFVNSEMVTTDKMLHDGDVISFGGFEMMFCTKKPKE
jgi:pSer/pThr/pTyr-binding forkhead associated (FHA) protein